MERILSTTGNYIRIIIQIWSMVMITFSFFLFLSFYLFIHERPREREREREKERQRERQREKQAPCREPNVGLDPGTLGPRPGPKAGLNL